MLNGRAKIKLMSAGLCLIAAGTAAPAVSSAQQNDAGKALQTAWAAPLSSLKDVQDIYAREMGMVSAMPEGILAPRAMATAALKQIRSDVLQAASSNKMSGDVARDTLNAIAEAETALTTDGAQTIAYSLETVKQQVGALQAKLNNQPAPRLIETAANGQPLPTDKAPDQQPGAANARARQMAEAQNRPQPQPVADQARETVAKAQDQQMKAAQANQPSPASAANQPQIAVADMKHDDVIGRYLFDNAGNDVGKIQSVRAGPDGKIQAIEIDVGGFLGIGARRIAVPAEALQLQGRQIQATSLTGDQIRSLPAESQ